MQAAQTPHVLPCSVGPRLSRHGAYGVPIWQVAAVSDSPQGGGRGTNKHKPSESKHYKSRGQIFRDDLSDGIWTRGLKFGM
jgi:hypothetical protein